MTTTCKPIDVWLKFDDDTDDEATYEANTFATLDSGETRYAIRYYHSDVGQITEVRFATLAEAYAWYEAHGFQDFTTTEGNQNHA